MINSIKSFLKINKNSTTIPFNIKLFTDFFQSDGLEHEKLSAFVKVQAVDYNLVYYLQRIYINGYTLSSERFYQCKVIGK